MMKYSQCALNNTCSFKSYDILYYEKLKKNENSYNFS